MLNISTKYNNWKSDNINNHKLYLAKNPKNTFLISTYIINSLIKNGWIKKNYDKNKIFDFCDNNNNTTIYNCVNNYNIWDNKFLFFHFFRNKYYMPTTFVIKNGNWLTQKPNQNELFIVKNPNTCKNLGNHLIDNKIDIEIHSNKYSNTFWIVQPLIKNLLLYNNKKFDIRIIASLISYDNFNFNLIVFKKGLIKKTCRDFDENSKDMDIHVTNISIQAKNNKDYEFILFDENFPNYKLLYDKILTVLKDIMKSSKKYFISHNKYNNNNKIIWNIGFDFIFTNSFDTYLIEINNDPGKETFNRINAFDYLAKNVYTPMALNQEIKYNFDIVDLI